MLRDTAAMDEAQLTRVSNFRYDPRAQVILGLEGHRNVEKYLMTSNGVRTWWYTFKYEHHQELIETMKLFHSGDLTSAKCFVPK